jgi:hypothetical protein
VTGEAIDAISVGMANGTSRTCVEATAAKYHESRVRRRSTARLATETARS